MDLGLSGKRALCAGSSAGMGKEAARALAAEGAELVMSARGADRLHAAVREIAEATGARITPVVADHGTPEGRAALLAACPEPDILVITCSPPRMTGGFREVEADEWMTTLETTLVGPIELMRAVLPGMAERKFGRVVNIGTGAAKNPHEMRLLSGPARAALANYSVSVSKKLARDNVTINTSFPACSTRRDRGSRWRPAPPPTAPAYESGSRRLRPRVQHPRWSLRRPADVGAFVAMLCGRYASFMTGQSLVIDGGLTNSVF